MLVYCVLFVTLWISCSQFEYIYTSYVYQYTTADTMYLQADIYTNQKDKIIVAFDGWHLTRATDPTKYNAIGEKHNDMTYNKKIESNSDPSVPHGYLAVDFLSIDVVSSQDFDEQHPAGTSLNDIVRFTAYSPYNYIQRSYTGEPEKEKIDKLLSECNAQDFLMTIARDYDWYSHHIESCFLQFVQAPQLAQQHTLTVTVVDDSGWTWEASIEMDWSK